MTPHTPSPSHTPLRVAILTLPLEQPAGGHNYGGVLQAYALRQFLLTEGFDAHVVDWVRARPRMLSPRGVAGIAKRAVNKWVLGRSTVPLWPWPSEGERAIIGQYTGDFVNRCINPLRLSPDAARTLVGQFDAFIVGSDQVWRRSYAGALLGPLLLDFVKEGEALKSAYGASFGVDVWQFSDATTRRIKQLLNSFDRVLVREDSAVALCRENLGVAADHVVDPTALLPVEHYHDLVSQVEDPPPSGGLLAYLLDDNDRTDRFIDHVASLLKMTPFRVGPRSTQVKAPLADRIYPSVFSWLRGFQDAAFVLTDSFHGALFAIMYNKPFIVIGNETRGLTRCQSLLRMVGLEHRLLSGTTRDVSVDRTDPIDWLDVNDRLEAHRRRSQGLLLDALGRKMGREDGRNVTSISAGA